MSDLVSHAQDYAMQIAKHLQVHGVIVIIATGTTISVGTAIDERVKNQDFETESILRDSLEKFKGATPQ